MNDFNESPQRIVIKSECILNRKENNGTIGIMKVQKVEGRGW